jgi:hypothetical protein
MEQQQEWWSTLLLLLLPLLRPALTPSGAGARGALLERRQERAPSRAALARVECLLCVAPLLSATLLAR